MSSSGDPRHAQFQSTRTTRPSITQRLSLRTSPWSRAPPSSSAASAADEQCVAPRVQPRRIEETERQRARRVGQQREPARPDVEELAEQSNDRLGRGRRLDRLERGEHGVDASCRPRGRPHRRPRGPPGRAWAPRRRRAIRGDAAGRWRPPGPRSSCVRVGATRRCSRRRRSWRRRRNRPRSPRATDGSTAPRARGPAPSRPAASRSRRGCVRGRHRRTSRNLRTPSRVA